MSQSVILELSDAEYAALRQAAQADGATPDEWAMTRLREQLPPEAGNGAEGAIHPENYALLRQLAARTGKSIEELAATWIRDLAPKPGPVLSPEEREAAIERLREHIVVLDHAIGADNDRIDADLAREYGDDHSTLYQPDAGKLSKRSG